MALRKVTTSLASQNAQQCMDCSITCLETLSHYLNLEAEKKDPVLVQHLRDCAELCSTTAKFIASGSYYRTELAMVCSEICDACSLDCEQFEADEQMRVCAKACEACATACRRMSLEYAA